MSLGLILPCDIADLLQVWLLKQQQQWYLEADDVQTQDMNQHPWNGSHP